MRYIIKRSNRTCQSISHICVYMIKTARSENKFLYRADNEILKLTIIGPSRLIFAASILYC